MSMNDLLIECQNKVAQLEAELEEVKALFVDAIGDGWYDGYMERIKDEKDEDDNTCSFNSEDVMHWSERYESEHRYAKSIADIRAKAVMNFAELPRGAYLSGCVTAELTVYDVYQSARNHVKDNYGYDTQPWDDDNATTARNALSEISACAGKAGFIAGVIHVNPTAEGRISLVDEANKYADSILQTAKDGE